MKQIIRLCEMGLFRKALELIEKDISAGSPTSELYRIIGQAELETGLSDNAINSLIEALDLEPNNINALLLLGNIYATHKEDTETALKYYHSAKDLDNTDALTFSNIAGVLAKAAKIEDAKFYFELALEKDPIFPNALYGLALVHRTSGKLLEAFELVCKCLSILKPNREGKILLSSAQALLIEFAREYSSNYEYNIDDIPLLKRLQEGLVQQIVIQKDNTIGVFAKLEVAEYYGVKQHVVKYKGEVEELPQLILHELKHLQFILEARSDNANEKYTTNAKHREHFVKMFSGLRNNLKKEGLDFAAIIKVTDQIFNALLGLLIENELFDEYHALRPQQFLIMYKSARTVLDGLTRPDMKRIIPHRLRHLNLVLAIPQMIHLKELFGYDLLIGISDTLAIKKGRKLYSDYLEIKDDKAAGEEYDLVRWWAEELQLDDLFQLVPEETSSGNNESWTPDDLIKHLETDPYALTGGTPYETEQMEKFLKAQAEKGTNYAVMFYMIDAVQHFKSLSKEQVKQIGFEIATIGRTGIDPSSEERWNLRTVPDKTFSGWMHFEPSVVGDFKLNFEEEYRLASKWTE